MSGLRQGPGAAIATCLLVLALALAACGKKNSPGPVEERKSEYTYPRQYPVPLPGEAPVGLPAGATAAEEADDGQFRLQRPQDQRLSPFPIDYGKAKTKTYGSFSDTPFGAPTE